MNIYTLDSLTKLFALAANRQIEENDDKFYLVFKKFLHAEIEDKFISDYTDIFGKYLKDFSSETSKKKVSLNSVKLIRICEEIKRNIPFTERLIVIYFLIVLIEETGCNKLSEEFTALISNLFSIPDKFYCELKSFINSKDNIELAGIYCNDVRIAEILISEFDILFIKSLKQDLKVNERQFIKGSTTYFLNDSVLIYRDSKRYFYPELNSLSKQQQPEKNFSIKVRELELKKKNKILLHKTSIDLCSGEMIAVLGKSGSGKTSFLRSVSGIEKEALGEVYLNRNQSDNNNIVKSFVPQNDNFIPLFSVEEHLRHRCSFLQFSKDLSKTKIDNVLSKTGLIEERNKIVCRSDKTNYQLSGGQQKRLGIAMELLNEPDVLFLDEPSSGLSSEDSYKIVSLLRSIANQNKIIVASIHQPDFDIFMMFDKILIIDEGGYPIYFGPPTKAVDYFRTMLDKVDKNSLIETKYNPAVLLRMIEEVQFDEDGNATGERKILPSEYYRHFIIINKLDLKGEKIKERKTFKQNHWLSFVNHLKFSIRIDIKQKMRLILLLLVPLLSGIVFSILLRYSPTDNYIYFYNPNVPVWILVLLTTAIFTGLVNSGHEFIFLRHFHQHENRIINKSYSYLFSAVFKYFVLALFQAVFLVFPSVLILENTFHFFTLFIVSFLLICWGSLISLILSGLCKQISTVYLVIPLIIIPQMIFSGAMINFGDFNKVINAKGRVPILADFVPMRWATEAVITDFYSDNPYYRDIYPVRQHINNAVYYLDYFIPQVEEIAKKDKIKAETILKNETKNYGFNNLSTEDQINLSSLKDYYSKQIQKYLITEDSIFMMEPNLYIWKFKYSNEAINKVINNPYYTPYIISEDKIFRNFKSIYSFPVTQGLNRSFFKSYGTQGNYIFPCFIYNTIIISFYLIVLVSLLYILKFTRTID